MLKNLTALTLLCASACGFAQGISIPNLKIDINFLASDMLKGRGTSTAEETVAANYIAASFKKLKLEPRGNDGYLYNFTFKTPAHPHDTVGTGDERQAKDVLAFLNNHAPTTVVIGAHYDHLGTGHDRNSLDANPEGKIHNGADDNASGTAGVIELARYFSQNKKTEKFNFLFICFSGEELGLIGSKKWCEKPTLPLDSINYMINMDMIGRLSDSSNKIIIYGVGTSPTWVPLIDKMQSPLSVKKDSSGIGPSDQTSFYLKNLPVLHFFTGQHKDYHKPSDDADKINYEGEKKVLQYITKLVEETETMPKLTFTKTKAPDNKTSGFKVTMGVMPDYSFEGKGMRVDGVTDGKPAAKAGLKQGDIVTALGDDVITDVMSYMKALGKFKKGDTTKVKVLRGNDQLEMSVTF